MALEKKANATVLISGSGSNLQALIDASQNGTLPINIIRVISNRLKAFGLERAKKANIPTKYHNLKKYTDDKETYPEVSLARQAYDKKLADILLEDSPEIVICAGWMHILTPEFLDPVAKANVPIINLHPALPGAYNGVNAIGRAHQDFMDGKVEKMGVMIHYVIAEVDMGEPIVVREIPLEHPRDDDLDELTERVHSVEHGAIVDGTRTAVQNIWAEQKAS